jgi:D-methionine transport system permease protein
MLDILLPALGETMYMSLVSTLFAVLIGLFLAVILILTSEGGLRENLKVYRFLDLVINTLRSFPFIILMIILFPVTKFLIGKSIGTTAAIIPLTIGAAPFIARLIESSLKEVQIGVIEAAKSFGASDMQIIFKVMFVEALPSIISAITLTLITVIGFSAMAGAVGGGGLGDVAIKYGYYRFQTDTMIYTVLILVALVQIVQSLGDYLYKNTKK